MEQGNIASWAVEEGQSISAGDVLAEIETDKATVDFEATDDGVVAKILVGSGAQDVPVGTPLIVLVEEEGDVAAFKDYVGGAAPAAAASAPAPAPAAAPAAAAPAPAAAPVQSSGPVRPSPAAGIIAARFGLDLGTVPATGPKGIITKADVMAVVNGGPVKSAAAAAAPAPAPAAAPAAAAVSSELPGVEGNPKAEIPHYYLSVDLDLRGVLASSKQLEAAGVEGNLVEALVIKATAYATKAVPLANSAWTATATRMFHDVNIACRGSSGEYTIPLADTQGVRAVASAASSGTSGDVMPTFTVDFLEDLAFARDIVGYGQSCVLSVGQPRQEAAMTSSGALKAQTLVTATLTCDHRTVDGAVGAEWLQAFRKAFETPAVLLI